MKKDPTIPVYLITGFLDGGKTNFLKYTMQQDYFNDGSKSLLILCEEGEEDYPADVLKKTKTKMVVVENEADLTPAYLQKLQEEYRPERIMIEFNGMWSTKNFLAMELPKYWALYQIITMLDGENFKLYLNNIKMTAMELLTNTDMVIFNRCVNQEDLVVYQRAVRSVNPRCQIVFEGNDGEEMECPEPDLPYDLEADPLVISDQDYGTFYIDLTDHPERYDHKTVTILGQILQNKRFPDNLFVAGRKAMTCCAEDVRFLPYIFIYDKAKSLAAKSWAYITAEVRWEYNEGYKEEGPVFHVKELKLANPPADELVYF